MPGPMRAYRIAAIPGDGIGVEVIAAGLRVLDSVAQRERNFRFDVKSFPWSSDYFLERGYYIPEGGLEELSRFDAIFFGAVGSQRVPDHVSLWGHRLGRGAREHGRRVRRAWRASPPRSPGRSGDRDGGVHAGRRHARAALRV